MNRNKQLLFFMISLDLVVLFFHTLFSTHAFWGTFFDLGQEANFPTWYASFKLTIAGIIAFLIFWEERLRATKDIKWFSSIWVWLLVALLMFFMSMDETAQLHETLARLFMQTGAGANLRQSFQIGESGGTLLWGILFSPILILLAGGILSFYIQKFKSNKMLILMSIVMIALLTISFWMEYKEAHIAGQLTNLTQVQFNSYQLLSLIEELCELFAMSLLIYIHWYYYMKLNQTKFKQP